MSEIYWGVEFLATLLEGYLGISVIETLGDKRFYDKEQTAFKWAAVVAYAVLVTLMNQMGLFSWATVLLAILLIAAGGFLISSVTPPKALFVSAMYIVSLSLLEGFLIAVMSFLNDVTISSLIYQTGYIRSVYLVLDKLIQCCLFLLYKLALKKTSFKLAPAFSYFLIVLLGLALMSVFVKTVSDKALQSYQYVTGICGVIVLICLFTLVQYFNKAQNYRQEQLENQKLQLDAQLIEQKYKQLNQRYHINSKNFHDFKNHLVAIDCLIQQEKYQEAREYIHHITNVPQQGYEKTYTGISVVDAILNEKQEQAQSSGITMTVDASLPLKTSNRVAGPDMCVILANLLDNALEACGKLPEGRERKIDVRIHPRNDFLILRIANTVAENPLQHNCQLKTTKKNSQLHGFGLQSVQSSVKRYNGRLLQNYQDGEFISMVIISYRKDGNAAQTL